MLRVTQLGGFNVSGGAASYAFTHEEHQTGGSAVFSFPYCGLGTPRSDRILVAAVLGRNTGYPDTVGAITNVTLNGTSMTKRVGIYTGALDLALYTLPLPNGTTGSVVVYKEGLVQYGCSVFLFAVYGCTSSVPTSTKYCTSVSCNLSMPVPATSVCVALAGVFKSYSGSSYGTFNSWTGLTPLSAGDNYGVLVGNPGGGPYSVAGGTFSASEASRTIVANFSYGESGFSGGAVAAVFD